MSNFICDQCGKYIYEGKGGHYITGCEHYPIEQMNSTQTPDNEVALNTTRTDAIYFNGLYSRYDLAAGLSKELDRELAEKTNEVARLREELDRSKEMVMDAARRGDEMAAHWKERAEKAEALVKQIHHYAGIIEGFQTK